MDSTCHSEEEGRGEGSETQQVLSSRGGRGLGGGDAAKLMGQGVRNRQRPGRVNKKGQNAERPPSREGSDEQLSASLGKYLQRESFAAAVDLHDRRR